MELAAAHGGAVYGGLEHVVTFRRNKSNATIGNAALLFIEKLYNLIVCYLIGVVPNAGAVRGKCFFELLQSGDFTGSRVCIYDRLAIQQAGVAECNEV